MKPGNIVVFAAHPDDAVIGAGGAIQKYAKEGYHVTVVVLGTIADSAGTLALSRKTTMQVVQRQSEQSARALGAKDVIFLPFESVEREVRQTKGELFQYVENILRDKKPGLVFVHDFLDSHADHSAAFNVLQKVLDRIGKSLKPKPHVFSFSVSSQLDSPTHKLGLSKIQLEKKLGAIRTNRAKNIELFRRLEAGAMRAKEGSLDKKAVSAHRKPQELFRRIGQKFKPTPKKDLPRKIAKPR